MMWPVLLLWIATSSTFGETRVLFHDALAVRPDVSLTSTDGREVRLSSFRGKPTVLFYEGNRSSSTNKKLKDELYRRGKERNLMNAANVVAVADLRGFNFFPVRYFAASKVEAIQKKVGVPVLIDWNGKLSTAPFNFPTEESTVMVMDSNGSVRFTHSGPLNEGQIQSLLSELEALVNSQKE